MNTKEQIQDYIKRLNSVLMEDSDEFLSASQELKQKYDSVMDAINTLEKAVRDYREVYYKEAETLEQKAQDHWEKLDNQINSKLVDLSIPEVGSL